MNTIFDIELRTWRWGYVTIQSHFDGNDFVELIKNYRAQQYLSLYESTYRSCTLWGGFCLVPPHPLPWLISIFNVSDDMVLPKFAHEAVHLAEMLTVAAGVPLSLETAEVRCQIVEEAVRVFEEKRTSGLFKSMAQKQREAGFVPAAPATAQKRQVVEPTRHQFRPQRTTIDEPGPPGMVPKDWSPGRR